MAKEFKIKVSEDLTVADVWMALNDYSNFLMEIGELEDYLELDVEEVK